MWHVNCFVVTRVVQRARDSRVTTDLTLASLNINIADSHSADPERLLLIHADAWSTRFETDLEAAAQLITPTVVSTDVVSPQWDLDLTLDVPDELEITQESSAVEQLMCLGVTLPPPIERPPVGVSVVPVDDPAPQLAGETSIQPRTELPSPLPWNGLSMPFPARAWLGFLARNRPSHCGSMSRCQSWKLHTFQMPGKRRSEHLREHLLRRHPPTRLASKLSWQVPSRNRRCLR
jgi:hypothetical protein